MQLKMAVLSLLLVPVAARAGAPQKPVWAWTTEERLQARFDPAAREARIRAFLAQRNADRSGRWRLESNGVSDSPRPTDIVRGLDHAELLLPFEIFSTFTRAAYAVEDETSRIIREDAAQKAAALGLPTDFLEVVERESQPYLELQRRELDLRDTIARGEGDPVLVMANVREIAGDECPLRAAAIRRLRARYGAAFDRFLYSAVAPGVFYDFFDPQSADALRAQEEGCR